MTEPLVRDVADRLIAYLREHPRAADTLEGIHQWWLASPSPGVTPQITQRALDLLEAEGRIERHAFIRCTVWRLRVTHGGSDGNPAP